MKYEIEMFITNLSRIVCPRHANRMVSPTIPATIPYPFFALFLLFVVLLDDLLVVVVVVVVVIVVPMSFFTSATISLSIGVVNISPYKKGRST